MAFRQEMDIILRYATKEEKAKYEGLLLDLNNLITEDITNARTIRENSNATGQEALIEIADYKETPAGKKLERGFIALSKQLADLQSVLKDRYKVEAAQDLPALFKDTETLLSTTLKEIDEDFCIDLFAYEWQQAKQKDKAFSYKATAKNFINECIDLQRAALKNSKTKTKEDSKAFREITNKHIAELLGKLTPDIEEQIQKKAKKPIDKTKRLTPVQIPQRFNTPNSYIGSNFMEILKPFYRENDGQMRFVPTNLEIDITGRSKGYVPVMLSINYEGDITKEGTMSIDYNKARIQGFDTAVLDAVCTILETGQNDIYVSAIDALLNGRSNIQAVGKRREERIILAFRKLGGTRVRLDITNELKGKYTEAFEALNLKSGVLDAAMLEYAGLELANYAGQKTYVIHVKEMPAIYQYSKAKGEITSFPTALLNTPERAEERYTTLKVSLLKRITLINKRVMNNNIILFESLYRAAGLEEHENKTQRSRERETLVNMLKHWKEQDYIKDYEAHYKGKSFVGFKIKPNYDFNKR